MALPSVRPKTKSHHAVPNLAEARLRVAVREHHGVLAAYLTCREVCQEGMGRRRRGANPHGASLLPRRVWVVSVSLSDARSDGGPSLHEVLGGINAGLRPQDRISAGSRSACLESSVDSKVCS
jgi:hypothetical protein